GSGGAGSATHLACVLLNSAIGINVTHVPYRAAALGLQDMIGGRIDYVCPIASTGIPHLEAGTVKTLANLSRDRSPLLPNIATAHEQRSEERRVGKELRSRWAEQAARG